MRKLNPALWARGPKRGDSHPTKAGGRSPAASTPPHLARRLAIESLEARTLLASDAFLASALIERVDFEPGAFFQPGEREERVLLLDAGQTLSLLATPSPGLALSLAVRTPTGIEIGLTNGEPGGPVLVNALPAPSSGAYTIVVTGTGSGAGTYSLASTINAAWEAESINLISNDAISLAEDMDASAVGWGATGVDRLAALGRFGPPSDVDVYRFTLVDGQSASLALQGSNLTNDLLVEILGPAGEPLARSVSTGEGVQAIARWTDATSDGLPSAYFARLSAVRSSGGRESTPQDYALLVGRGIDLEFESNDHATSAQATPRVLARLGERREPGASLAGDFAGIDALSAACACEPPDTHLAVGPRHVVEVVNTALAIYNKDGSFARTPIALDLFFDAHVVAKESFLFDPVVAYDELAGRFIVAILIASSSDAAESDLLYAVSNSSDPTAGFAEQHRIDFGETSPGLFADYPKIGFNADAHVVTVNMFGAGFENVDVLIIDKESVLDANSATLKRRILARPNTSFTLAPATMHRAVSGAPLWFVEETSIGGVQRSLRVVRLTDVVSAAPRFTNFVVTVPTYQGGGLPGADQPGGSKFTTNDSRILNVAWRDGRLVAVHTAGDGQRALVHWYDFDVAGDAPVLTQTGVIDPGPNVATFYPSIALGPEGQIGVNYLQSSADEFVSMYVAGQARNSIPGSLSAGLLVKAGNRHYLGSRGGDYSGIAVDPVSGTFWAANEVILAGAPEALWSTWIAEFSIDPLDDEDWYEFAVAAGDALELATATPLDGPLLIENPLDPVIELYGPAGQLVARDDNSGGDGRNAALSVAANVSGRYRARVVAASDREGVYTLTAQGATGPSSPTHVAATTPPSGAVTRQFPETVQLRFSAGVRLASLQPQDLLVGGLPAHALLVVDGQTIRFTTDPLAQRGDGSYSVVLAAGAVVDLHGNPVEAFNGTFRVDTTGPRLLSTQWNGESFPANRKFSPGPLTFTAAFDEDLLTLGSARRGLRTPGADDVLLFESITGATFAPQRVVYDRARFSFTAEFGALPEGNYALRLESGNQKFEDAIGNDLDGEFIGTGDGAPTGNGLPGGDYRVEFAIDVGARPALLNPFTRLEPVGSQAFASRGAVGAINAGGGPRRRAIPSDRRRESELAHRAAASRRRAHSGVRWYELRGAGSRRRLADRIASGA